MHDTITMLPVSRPRVPAPDDFIPGLTVARYTVRRPWWVHPPARHAGFAVGGALACLVPVSYAIAQILGGQA